MPLVVGTAGHIDHGKTALVRALTGQDTLCQRTRWRWLVMIVHERAEMIIAVIRCAKIGMCLRQPFSDPDR
jgi:translation initiation factor 2 gamma subunit (eIF-2gamma)